MNFNFKKIYLLSSDREFWPSHLMNFSFSSSCFLVTDNDLRLIDNYLYFDREKNKIIYQTKEWGAFFLDLEKLLQTHLSRNYALNSEPLYKALGIANFQKKFPNKKLIWWDTTAGFGGDTMLILSFLLKKFSYDQIQGVAFERNEIMGLLWADAIQNLSIKFDFYSQDFSAHLCIDKPHIIFYDPMYPIEKKKSALPKKSMQLFHQIIEKSSADDEPKNLAMALAQASFRVIVKRPIKAMPIAIATRPSTAIMGKTTRYDIYLC